MSGDYKTIGAFYFGPIDFLNSELSVSCASVIYRLKI